MSAFGVRELWIVDFKERSIEVFENAGRRFQLVTRYVSGETLESRVLPRLALPLDSIF